MVLLHFLSNFDLYISGFELNYGENSDYLRAEESALPNLAKEVEDNSRYKILEANATVVKLLVDDKDGVSR